MQEHSSLISCRAVRIVVTGSLWMINSCYEVKVLSKKEQLALRLGRFRALAVIGDAKLAIKSSTGEPRP